MADPATKKETETIEAVDRILMAFAKRTGLSPVSTSPVRYLWTDAQAVCALLGLHQRTRASRYLELAEALIDQVHEVLGKHRPDAAGSGWLSGLDADEGARHPTAGGLRIGKALPERAPDAPFDEALEWQRDGQYLHYLTKWAHALCRAHAVIGQSCYLQWAVTLARVAHCKFVTTDGRGLAPRYVWKMSTDLSRPLVTSTGLHDALDVYITCHEIRGRAMDAGGEPSDELLEPEIAASMSMFGQQHWATADPLGIGGLLFDAARIVALTEQRVMTGDGLDTRLFKDALTGLGSYIHDPSLQAPAERRLAFRELGLTAGLHAIRRIRLVSDLAGFESAALLRQLERYLPLAERIESYWREPVHQQASSWREHEDINSIGLALSLLPDQYLTA